MKLTDAVSAKARSSCRRRTLDTFNFFTNTLVDEVILDLMQEELNVLREQKMEKAILENDEEEEESFA